MLTFPNKLYTLYRDIFRHLSVSRELYKSVEDFRENNSAENLFIFNTQTFTVFVRLQAPQAFCYQVNNPEG